MLPILHIGPLALQAPGLILLLGVWLGLNTAERLAERFHSSSPSIYSLVLISLLAGILGARLGYALQYLSIFMADPLSLFSLTPTMLNTETGLLAGGLTGMIYANRKALPVWPTLDTLAAGFTIFMIAWHLANFASGNAFGTPTRLPWGIDLWGEHRHPVQLYEMAAAMVIAALLLSRKNLSQTPGHFFWAFVGLSALARLFLEYFRGDSITMIWNIHNAQVIAWLIAAVALWQFRPRRVQIIPSAPADLGNESVGTH